MGFQMESIHVMCSTVTKKERRPHTNTWFPDTREKKQEKGKKQTHTGLLSEGSRFQNNNTENEDPEPKIMRSSKWSMGTK